MRKYILKVFNQSREIIVDWFHISETLLTLNIKDYLKKCSIVLRWHYMTEYWDTWIYSTLVTILLFSSLTFLPINGLDLDIWKRHQYMCNTLSSHEHTKIIFWCFLYYKIIHLENSKHQIGQPKFLFLTVAAVVEPEFLFMFACVYPW